MQAAECRKWQTGGKSIETQFWICVLAVFQRTVFFNMNSFGYLS